MTPKVVCSKCGREMPDSIIHCWQCGQKLKESLDKSVKSRRNPLFLDREQTKTPKRRK